MIPLSDPDLVRQRFPYVNIALIAVNAVVFLYILTLSSADTSVFFYKWGLIPAELTGGKEFTRLFAGRDVYDITSPLPAWGTVFSAMFIHGGFMHFIGNMVFLWVFGDNVESRLGHVQYLVFYLAVGVAAAWTQVAMNMHSDVPNIGASGAIAGVLGAYLVLYPYSRINTLVIFFIITVVRIPALYVLGFWFLLQLFSGVGSFAPSAQSEGGVAYWAHVGGFVAGVLAIALYLKLRRQPLRTPHWRFPTTGWRR